MTKTEASRIVDGYLSDIDRRKSDLAMEIKQMVDETYQDVNPLFRKLESLMKVYDELDFRERELKAQQQVLQAIGGKDNE